MLTSDQLRTLSPICNLDHQLGRVSHSLKLIKCKFIIFHHFLQPYIMWLFLFSVLLWAWCFLQNQTIFKNLMMNRRKKTGKVCVSGYSREESFTPARLTMLLSLCSCSSCVFVRPFKCLFSSKTCFIWNSKSSFCSANSNKIDKIDPFFYTQNKVFWISYPLGMFTYNYCTRNWNNRLIPIVLLQSGYQ